MNSGRGPEVYEDIRKRVEGIFLGSERSLRLLLIGLAAPGHVLIEDVPGVGKTTLARTVARTLGLDYGRIQFTPDLLPGDILGVSVWDPQNGEFRHRPGAIMHQYILADEINRASPRTQSALLEAMQESRVTVDGVALPLPRPFFVVATQNPENYVGTFDLPEGQLDRFLLSIRLGYPRATEEEAILEGHIDESEDGSVHAAADAGPLDAERVRAFLEGSKAVRVDGKIRRYVVEIARATRADRSLVMGMSPRASLHLLRAARAGAFVAGRDYTIPEDVAEMAVPVLRHRLRPTIDARAEGRGAGDIVDRILQAVPIPTGLA